MGVRRGVGFFCRCFNALGGGGRGRLLHVVSSRWFCLWLSVVVFMVAVGWVVFVGVWLWV